MDEEGACMSAEKFKAVVTIKNVYLAEYIEQMNNKDLEPQDFATYVASRLKRDFIAVDRILRKKGNKPGDLSAT